MKKKKEILTKQKANGIKPDVTKSLFLAGCSNKLYQATVVASNSCYIETLLIIAKNKKEANEILCKHEKREVEYKEELKELKIDMTKPNVIPYVGWGENESDYGYDD